MVDALLHAGTEHAELTWIVLASLLAVGIGFLIGAYSDRIRDVVNRDAADPTSER